MDMKKRAELELGKEIDTFLLGFKVVKTAMDAENPEMGDAFLAVLKDKLSRMRSKPVADPVKARKKAMISQPMGGLADEEIVATRGRAICELRKKGYLFENTLFTDEWYEEEISRPPGFVRQRPLFFLAKSLEAMSRCDAVYFCKGWEKARGCRIEHETAVAYGMEIIYEE